MKTCCDFARFFVGDLCDFALFADALAGVMLGVAAGGEVSAEAHRDGAGGDFGKPGDDDEAAVVDRAGDAGGQGEGDGEAVGHADDDVANDFAGGEVTLNVRCLRHAPPARDGPERRRGPVRRPRARLCSLT